MSASLDSSRPGNLRVLLIVEVLGYLVLLAAFLWFALPPGEEITLVHALFVPAAIVYPIVINRRHGDSWRDGGCRLDTLGASLRGIAVPIGIALLAILLIGAVVGGNTSATPARFLRNVIRYVAWGPVQQYLLCGFVLRRLLQAGLSRRVAMLTATVAFGTIHAPNPALVGLATGMALLSCSLFLRYPNILALGLAHGVLAVATYHALPVAWHEKLTVGGIYRARMEQHAERNEVHEPSDRSGP